MKMWKNVKALSPVVASIILIAVTVAVSIAVAVWMGAISFTFMTTEELQFTTHSWSIQTINITIKNTGASPFTLIRARVGDTEGWTGSSTLAPGIETTITLTNTAGNWTSGVKYNFYVETARGNVFGPYQKVAP